MVKCPNCNKEFEKAVKFCDECGAKIEAEQAAEPVSTAEPALAEPVNPKSPEENVLQETQEVVQSCEATEPVDEQTAEQHLEQATPGENQEHIVPAPVLGFEMAPTQDVTIQKPVPYSYNMPVPQPEKPKKKGKKIGIIAGVAAVIVIVIAIIASLGGSDKKAYEASKIAYDNINTAYELTEQYASDIYTAWQMGIYDDDEIYRDGAEHLAGELSLSEDEIINALIEVVEDLLDKESDDVKSLARRDSGALLEILVENSDISLFTFCTRVVIRAYEQNGDAAKIEITLSEAQAQIKILSEDYSDYEHYENIKGYYTSIKAFFDFCQEPLGSFEQIKTTINDYRNDARSFHSSLDYIFEDAKGNDDEDIDVENAEEV